MVDAVFDCLHAFWSILREASIYVLFGLLVGGIIRGFLSPQTIAKHLQGRGIGPVIKAAILGIPLPLCSCGVAPTAASLRRQGASKPALVSFLISTPESGIDSIAVSYALLDPIMTVCRPIAAFITAVFAGLAESSLGTKDHAGEFALDSSCPIDNCCSGVDCTEHSSHHSFFEKVRFGVRFAFTELWDDLAVWFLIGAFVSAIIIVAIPEGLFAGYLGGGLHSMLLMLLLGLPLYICASASTPLAAALILKGASPGAALVFLLAGPATNVASASMVVRLLGRRSSIIYLASIAVVAVSCGLAIDWLYGTAGIQVRATAGTAAELMPLWVENTAAVALVALSIRPLAKAAGSFRTKPAAECTDEACHCS